MHTVLLSVLTVLTLPVPEPGYLDRHDLVWEKPPVRWLDGIPLANGDMGVLIWGDGGPFKFTLDKYDAWETTERILGPGDLTYAKLRRLVEQGKRVEAERAMRTQHLYPDGAPHPTRLPMPRLEIDFGQPLVWSHARLGLRTATATVVGTADGRPLQLTCAVSAEQNVLLVRMKGVSAANARIRVGLDHLNDSAKQTLKRWGYPDPVTTSSPDGGTLSLTTPSGYAYAIAWKRVHGPGDVHVLALSLISSLDAPDPLAAAGEIVDRYARTTVDLSAHEAWWAEYWKRSYLTIPDARLEALYSIEMYKLGCLSRPGKMPITLQGLWTLDGGMPPWAGDYHLDMNVQQSYWPIYTANRLELGEPLYRTFSACLPRWRKQCQQFFGFDGIWSGCAIGPRGERVFGYTGVELWPGNAAWLAHHYWLHFLYSQDKKFLREQALLIIRPAFLTYANLLERGDDGKLHVPFSYSPEWGEGGISSFCRDPNIDLALIRFLGGAILEADKLLPEADPLADRAREVLENLTGYQIKNNRLMVRADATLSHSHRHHSHLAAIHPLGLLTVDGSESQRTLIQNSLHDIRVQGTGQWTGWAYPWMSLIASRAELGNMAWQMLDTYANAFIKPNTFHVNGDPRRFGVSLFTYEPMTLEAGFGAAAAIMEMLLQSHGGRIRLFASTPDRWHDAYFANLRAEGAFLVTAKLTKGKVRFVQLTSEVGHPCRMRNPFDGQPVVLRKGDPETGESVTLSGEILEFETQPGATYLLHGVDARPTAGDLQPPIFQRSEQERNYYGLKRLARF